MSTEVLVDTVSTTTDSCQMVATETTLQVTAVAKSDNQTTTNEAYAAIPPRRTFNEQKPFVFSIIGFAVVIYCSTRYRTNYQSTNGSSFLKRTTAANKKNKSPK